MNPRHRQGERFATGETEDKPDELVLRAMEELEARGMRRVEVGLLEVSLSARFTGRVSLPFRSLTDLPARAVLVTPRVEVRDEEVSRLVADLRGLAPGDPGTRGHNLVMRDLNSLIPERGSLPSEWAARSEAEAGDAARRIVDDIVVAGFPYMQSMASPEAYFAEFTQQVWKLLWPHEAAVAYMMHGELGAAKRTLMTVARPVAQQPATWAEQDRSSADFFAAFSARFGVDLGIEEWPVQGD